MAVETTKQPCVLLRSYRDSDYPTVAGLWRAEGTNPFTPRHLRRLFASGGKAIVADADSSVCGVVLWTHNGRQAFVWRLNVACEMRGHGIGTLLMDAVECAAAQAGFESIGLLVGRDNSAAKALYAGRGWVQNPAYETWFKELGTN